MSCAKTPHHPYLTINIINKMKFKKVSKKNLQNTFNLVNKSKYKGVYGVYEVDSGNKGPVIGITMCTHGNEPSGLAAMHYLINEYNIKDKLKKGRVLFVLNNRKAVEKYFRSKKQLDKERCRYLELNMNRLPDNLETLKDDKRYEVVRAKELIPIWGEFNCATDIHSTLLPSEPMIIEVHKGSEKYTKGFPIKRVIKNIAQIQIGKPACFFYGNKLIKTVEIEAGSHEDQKSYETAIKCTLSFLANTGVIIHNVPNTPKRISHKVVGSIILPDTSYSLPKIFKTFQRVRKGEVLASNGTDDIVSPVDGTVIFAPRHKKVSNTTYETMFITDTPKKLQTTYKLLLLSL